MGYKRIVKLWLEVKQQGWQITKEQRAEVEAELKKWELKPKTINSSENT